jgi:hypothetical protein
MRRIKNRRAGCPVTMPIERRTVVGVCEIVLSIVAWLVCSVPGRSWAQAGIMGDTVTVHVQNEYLQDQLPPTRVVVGSGQEWQILAEGPGLNYEKIVDVGNDCVTASQRIWYGGSGGGSLWGIYVTISDIDWFQGGGIDDILVVSQNDTATVVEWGWDWIRLSLGGADYPWGWQGPYFHEITVRLVNNTLPADVQLLCHGPSSPLRVGDDLDFGMTVTNAGPGTGQSLRLQERLPAMFQLQEVQASLGSWNVEGSDLIWHLGSLGSGESAEISLSGQLTSGLLVSSATVSAIGMEYDLVNNSADVAIAVECAGRVSARDAQVVSTRTSQQDAGAGGSYSLWSRQAVPAGIYNDGRAIEIGTKFLAAVPGYVTGLRFFKGSQSAGIHEGHLWSGTGTLLGSVQFTDETASDWQDAVFTSPIAVEAGTTYVASVHCADGYYPFTGGNYFASRVTSGPLVALRNGEDGPNGVFAYSNGPICPSSGYDANYWVDVVFDPEFDTLDLDYTGPVEPQHVGDVFELNAHVSHSAVETSSNVVATIGIPRGVTVLSCEPSCGAANVESNRVRWVIGDMTSSSFADLTVRVAVEDLIFHVDAVLDGEHGDLDLSNNTSTISVPVECANAAVVEVGRVSTHMLRAVRPNPFNPRTTIKYDLPATGPVRLSVFDVAGRLVRTLVDENKLQGSFEAVWDGRDSSGKEVSSGSYLARLEFGGKVETVRMGLVR